MKTFAAPIGSALGPTEPIFFRPAFLATWARIPVGGLLIECIISSRALLGTITLTLFVILDVVDGVIARAQCADDSYRRGLDSAVDRLTVTTFFVVAASHSEIIWPAASVILVTNVAAIPFSVVTWRRSRVVLKAPAWHRSWSLILYLAGLLYFVTNLWPASVTAIVGALVMAVCTINLVLAHVNLRRRVSIGSDWSELQGSRSDRPKIPGSYSHC